MTFTAPSRSGRGLDVQRSELLQLVLSKKDAAYFAATRSLMHLLEASTYHIKQLTKRYGDVIEWHVKYPHHVQSADRVVTHCNEVFFEFDALANIVMQGVNSTRRAVWRAYGDKGSVRSNLRDAVARCKSVPNDIKERLEVVWADRLSHAKEYRDCIQHHVAVGSASWAMLTRVDHSFWNMIARIPDNPESKSERAFTFHRDLDALTYGWELTNDLYELANLVLGTILARSNK